MQAIQDIGFVLLTLFILITLVRAVPLMRDLWATGSCSPLKYRTKIVLIKHAVALAYDVKCIIGFIACTIVVVVLVGGIPSYLRDLPSNIDTYDRAYRIAAKHASKSLGKLCEVMMMMTMMMLMLLIK